MKKNIAQRSIWDLHFHTAKSHDYEIKEAKIEDIIDKVLEKMDIKLIVITDHMIFDCNQFERGNLHINKKGYELTLLPGVELKISVTNGGHYDMLLATHPKHANDLQDILELIAKEKDCSIEMIALSMGEMVNYFKDIEYVIYPEFNKSCGVDKKVKSKDEKMQLDKMMLMRSIKILNAKPAGIEQTAKILENFFIKNKKDYTVGLVSASDNHNYMAFPFARENVPEIEKESHKFVPTYFKALNTFEGLKMVASEQERISFEPDDSIPWKDSKIQKISFSSKDQKINEVTFSPNLNVIIGARSNGKSFLLNLINKEFFNPGNLTQDELKTYKALECNYNIDIKTFNDKKPDEINNGKIIFYSQNYFIHQFLKTNQNDFNDLLNSFGIEKFHFNDVEIKSSLESFENSLLDQISKYEHFITKIKAIKNVSTFINDCFKFVKDDEKRIAWKDNNNIKNAFTSAIEIQVKDNIKKFTHDLNKYKQIKSKLKGIQNEMASLFVDDKEKINKGIESLLKIVQRYIQENTIFMETIRLISEYIREERISESKINNSLKELMTEKELKYGSFYQLGVCISELSKNESESFFNAENLIKFEKNEAVNSKVTKNTLIECNRSIEIVSKMKDFIDRTFYKDAFSNLELIGLTRKILTDENFKLIKDKNYKDNLSSLFYIKDSLDIIYNGERLNEVSPGKKAEILVEVLLSEEKLKDKALVMIDQPEDSLDNVYISDALVKKIKDIKNKKQIIIATHNANLVVNTDAENVVFADKGMNNEINYFNGAIEYTEEYKGQNIIQIIETYLEGGKQALEKRIDTYNSMLNNDIKYEDINN